MKKEKKVYCRRFKNESGFTLIEILIVVILLGILATIIIPQVSISTDDAKLNTLKTNLGNLRGAVELYYYQHSNKYPGQQLADGSGVAGSADAPDAFVNQLTRYTSITGATAASKDDTTYKYGPYLKDGIPDNPINDKNTVACDTATNDITAKSSDGNDGYKFYIKTGVLMSDDGANDSL